MTIRLDARDASEGIDMDIGDQFAFYLQLSASSTSYVWQTVGGDVLTAVGTGITTDGSSPTGGVITSMTIDLNSDSPSSPDIVISDVGPAWAAMDFGDADESFDYFLMAYFNQSHEIYGSGFDDFLRGWSNADSSVIYAGAGNDTVQGGNNISTFYGEAGNDTLRGGVGDDRLYGGIGDDLLNGGNGDDTLTGDSGTDQLEGGNGNDQLDGGDGNDVLNGGNGDDLLFGGTGVDDLAGGNGDDLLDGGTGADTMTGALDGDTYVVDNIGDTVVEYGNGTGIDTVQAHINYTLADEVEVLRLMGSVAYGAGNGQDNTLYGNAAANTLDGKSGADRMEGLGGNDIYYVDNLGDQVVEAAAGGTDTVRANINYTLGANLEWLELLGLANLAGTGNALNNTIVGNSGNNALSGGDGDDVLNGGQGADTLAGGAGSDWVSYQNAATAVVVNLTSPGANTGEAAGDAYNSIENIIGSAFNDRLTGDAAANTIRGGAGSDTLNGGAGADRMEGGAGNDVYWVDNAGDLAVELAGEGYDTVRAAISFSLSGSDLERLELGGSTNINGTGNSLNNVIVGNSGANILSGLGGDDTLEGGAGADTLDGDAGNDTLDGGTGIDRMEGGTGNDIYWVDNAADVAFELNGEGTDTVNASVSFNMGGSELENLALRGPGNINGTGNSIANVITGNSGANVLLGLGGNDTLAGAEGHDTLDGGVGADQMEGGIGNDTYYVDNAGDTAVEANGAGTDTVYSSVSFNMGGSELERLYLTGSANINGTGSSIANLIRGNSYNNTLLGLGGNDTLQGLSGNDTLDGGAGVDRMEGGVGNDVYWVDDAGDSAIEFAGGGYDTVHSAISFDLGGSDLERLELRGPASINGTGNSLNNVVVGNSGANVLSGLGGNDTLAAAEGNDTLDGGLGADYLSGGAGYDRATYINATAGVKASLTNPSQNTGEAAGDTYNSIEYLTGSNFSDSLLGNAGANRISGSNGNDAVNGMAGDDVIFGGSGNDRIYGHLGADVLEGNAGQDTFIFHTALGTTNIDTITDFSRADDTIELENAIFTALTATGVLAASAFKDIAVAAKDANDRIIYNSATGILYYDADGSGSAYGNVKFAVLDGKPILTAADFFVV